MSLCSFLSDPEVNDSESQSFLDFSLDTSNIDHLNNQLDPRVSSNLTLLQKLLCQTNLCHHKLESKMSETQRKLDLEICIRKVKAHQTVLNLKMSESNIDSSFMNFVQEKHRKLLKEVEKVLDGCNENELTQGGDTTGLSSPQATPAFSGQKNFSFKEFDCLDLEISSKINSVFYKFFQYPGETQALEGVVEGNFVKKFPRIGESLQKVVKSLGMYRTGSKRQSISSAENVCKDNSELRVITNSRCVQKALALQELHLNLDFLKKKLPENSEKTANFTQTLDTEDYHIKVQGLEVQLKELTGKLESLQKENEDIQRYQNELISHIRKNKGFGKENCEFFKDRYENSNRILVDLQEKHKKVLLENEKLKGDLRKKSECKGYLGESWAFGKLSGARYELAAGIKDLEKVQKEVAHEGLNKVIVGLHTVSLMLIKEEVGEKQVRRVPKIPIAKLQSRSKSSFKSAGDQLEQYILNY